MVLEILLGTLVVINIILVIGVRNLLKQNRQLENMVLDERDVVYNKLTNTLETLKSIDSKGSFESDDEVGAVFTDIKEAIKELHDTI